MYTLRKITESGIEFNQFLGKNYELVLSEKSGKLFNEIYNEFFQVKSSTFQSEHPVEEEKCYGFVHGSNGQETYALFKNEKAYIVSESGKTFANICY